MLAILKKAKVRRQYKKLFTQMHDAETKPEYKVEVNICQNGQTFILKSNFYISEEQIKRIGEIILKFREPCTVALKITEKIFNGQCTVKVKEKNNILEIVVVNTIIDL